MLNEYNVFFYVQVMLLKPLRREATPVEYLIGTSTALVGRSILYHWEGFGWWQGKVTERDIDSMRQIDR